MAQTAFEAAGIPSSGGPCNWKDFAAVFEKTPLPANPEESSLLAARLSRDLSASISSFQLMRSLTANKIKSTRRVSENAQPTGGGAGSAAAADGGHRPEPPRSTRCKLQHLQARSASVRRSPSRRAPPPPPSRPKVLSLSKTRGRAMSSVFCPNWAPLCFLASA